MLGFSSTLRTTAFNGGFRYSPTTSAALGANSLSVLTHQLPPLQIDSFAAQNTPAGMNAGVELFRHRRPVPVGHAEGRRPLQHGEHPVAKCGAYLTGLPGRSWSRSPLR